MIKVKKRKSLIQSSEEHWFIRDAEHHTLLGMEVFDVQMTNVATCRLMHATE